jgi:hypothetical protein
LPTHGVDPEHLWRLGEQLGYRVETSWASSRSDGSYDAVLRRLQNGGKSPTWIKWPQAGASAANLSQYSNQPAVRAYRRKLISLLAESIREKAPSWATALEVVLVETLPDRATQAIALSA